MARPELQPAGFWLRYAAWSLDAVCLLPLVLLLGLPRLAAALGQAKAALQALSLGMTQAIDQAMLLGQSPLALTTSLLFDPRWSAAAAQLTSALTTCVLLPPLVYALLACPWALAFECSARQATPGKRAFGLIVGDARGQRLLPTQALARFAAAGLSWLSLNLGHAMAAFAPHLALHDRLSHTRVLVDAQRCALPAWGKAWLFAQALAAVVACVWGFLALQAWMQSLMALALAAA